MVGVTGVCLGWWRKGGVEPAVDGDEVSKVEQAVSSLLLSGDPESALEMAQSALDSSSSFSDVMLFLKGKALMALDPERCAGGSCRQHAAAAFSDCLGRTATLREEATSWLLKATTNLRGIDGTSRELVSALFDDYSSTFESHLVRELQYSAPPIIAEAVAIIEKKFGKLRVILDVGCGTGLVGKKLREAGVRAELRGLDVSPKMADIAAHFYDSVKVCDARNLLDCVSTTRRPLPDLAVLGDVVVYLDDRDAVDVLRQLGSLDVNFVVVTLERPSVDVENRLALLREEDEEEWRTVLGASGRFAHNVHWIVRHAQTQLDFDLIWIAELCDTSDCPYPPLRYERADPVRGAVVVFKKRR